MRVFESKLANAKLAIATMFVVLVISIILNFILAIGLATAPNHVKVYQAHCDGTTQIIDPQKVSYSRLQWFVSHVWVRLNSWKNNGKADVPVVFKSVSDQITPRFKQAYENVLGELKSDGLFDNYILSTVALDGDAQRNVKKTDGGWLVRVTYISTFYFNPYGTSQDYQDEVTTANVSAQRIEQSIVFKVVQFPNKWGLAIDQIVDSQAISDGTNQNNKKHENNQNSQTNQTNQSNNTTKGG